MIQILLMNSGKLFTFNNKHEAISVLQGSLNFNANHILRKQIDGHREQIQSLINAIKKHDSNTPVMTQLSGRNIESIFTAVRVQRSTISIYHATIPRLETDLQLVRDCISHKNRIYRVPVAHNRTAPISMMDFVHHIQDIVLVLTPFKTLSKADNQYLCNGILALSKSAKKHVDYGSNIIVSNMTSILNKVGSNVMKHKLVNTKK